MNDIPASILTWQAPDCDGNRELSVIAMLDRVLASLQPGERRRVLAWVNNRFAEEASEKELIP
jgi:hypothetical protein